jgi:hypothetical protein
VGCFDDKSVTWRPVRDLEFHHQQLRLELVFYPARYGNIRAKFRRLPQEGCQIEKIDELRNSRQSVQLISQQLKLEHNIENDGFLPIVSLITVQNIRLNDEYVAWFQFVGNAEHLVPSVSFHYINQFIEAMAVRGNCFAFPYGIPIDKEWKR